MASNTTRGRAAVPAFLAEGRGLCVDVGNRDDWTNESLTQAGAAARKRAQAVCVRCIHRIECLAWALKTDQTGVYGATTTSQRRRQGEALLRVVA